MSSFIPNYLDYYSGGPTGPGFCNLYPYEVSGRVYGTSEKTGKATNRKKIIYVNASSSDDAQAAALSAGVSPPYEYIRLIDQQPTREQFRYIDSIRVPYPAFINSDDIRALLTRYQDCDDEHTPPCLFRFATSLRVRVSYFDPPRMILSYIWHCTPSSIHPALFCYSVYCRERGEVPGGSRLQYTHPLFSGFSLTDRQCEYISRNCGLYKPRRSSSAYRSAIEYLSSVGLL